MALFAKLKGKEKQTLLTLFTFIVTGTQGATHDAIVPLNLAKQILKSEPNIITINGDADPAGNVHVSATPDGIAAAGLAAPVASDAPPAAKPVFVLESGFDVPEIRRGGVARESIYPFENMGVGQSFFVPATEENPTPAKGLMSTCSSANKRFAATYPMTVGKDKTPHAKAGQSTGKDGRKFTVRARTVADGEKSNGARVYRIA